jgi:hypothetical protein
MLKQTGPRTDARYAGNRNARQENFFLFLKEFAEEKAFCRSVIGDKSAHMNAGARSRRLSIETKIIIGFSLVALLVHLLTNQRYGFFRDELYFIACARHLDFGYVDLAPLSAVLLRIELMLFGTSLFALRLFPAIAGAFLVALTAALARELGGRAWAVALSCVAALCALVYLSIGNFYSLNVYEPLLWTGYAHLLVRIINGGSRVCGFGSESASDLALRTNIRSPFLRSLWSQAFC